MALPQAAQRERGHAGTNASGYSDGGYWTSLLQEQVPELRWPWSIATFRRMEDSDAQIASVLQAVTAPIIRTGWGVDGGDGVDRAVTEFVAANLGLPIRGEESEGDHQAPLRGRDRFSWLQHLVEALEFLPFGHAVFEQVYRFDDDGMARLRKLGYRPAHTIAKFNVAPDGGLVSIEQRAAGQIPGALTAASLKSITGAVLPINRLVVYTHMRRGANWRGKSVLRPAYKNWLLKDDALKNGAIAIERNSSGLPVYTAKPDSEDEQAELDRGLDIAEQARAGDNSGVAVPNGAALELLGVKGSLTSALDFVKYQDEQIARAVLAHFLNLGSQTGSWALGSTFADFFTLSLQAIAEEIRETATRHIVEDLVDINFGPTVPAPRIVFDEIGSRTGDGFSALVRVRKLAGLEDDKDLAEFIQNSAQGESAP